MTEDAQRIAIAELCGWVDIQPAVRAELRFKCYTNDPNSYPPDEIEDGTLIGRYSPRALFEVLPDYLYDLNAMHEAEKALVNRPILARAYTNTYGDLLFQRVMSPGHCLTWFATAADRAQAFLRTHSKWIE